MENRGQTTINAPMYIEGLPPIFNKFMFGKAAPYGAALGAYLKSVADKGYTFYEEASGEKK
jgi:hypothetical protein